MEKMEKIKKEVIKMTSIEERLKNLINEKYGSLLQFSKQIVTHDHTASVFGLFRGFILSAIQFVIVSYLS